MSCAGDLGEGNMLAHPTIAPGDAGPALPDVIAKPASLGLLSAGILPVIKLQQSRQHGQGHISKTLSATMAPVPNPIA